MSRGYILGMTTYTATAHMRPTVKFLRVAAVLSALVIVLSIFSGSLFNPPDDGGQKCQSEPALIAQPITSDYVSLCVSDSTLSGEYQVIPPPQ